MTSRPNRPRSAARYGDHYFGQCCLLAAAGRGRGPARADQLAPEQYRRDRAGPGYDTHQNHFALARDQLYPRPTWPSRPCSKTSTSADCSTKPWSTSTTSSVELPRSTLGAVATTGPPATARSWPAAGSKGSRLRRARTRSAPIRRPIRSPQDVLATIYHAARHRCRDPPLRPTEPAPQAGQRRPDPRDPGLTPKRAVDLVRCVATFQNMKGSCLEHAWNISTRPAPRPPFPHLRLALVLSAFPLAGVTVAAAGADPKVDAENQGSANRPLSPSPPRKSSWSIAGMPVNSSSPANTLTARCAT